MNVKNILVPIDYSDCSQNAVSYAIELALNLEASLYLMHTMQNAFSMSSERLLERLVKDDRLQKIGTHILTEIGDPGAAILRQSKEVGVDLILMGSKGSSGGRKLLGSTVTEVISQSEIPVLAVPLHSTYSGFKDVVFMTDFNQGDLSALKEISDWAMHFNANLHVLHLFTDESLLELIKFRGFKEVAKEHLNYEKLSFERVFDLSFKDGFFNYLKTRDSQLIILTRYKKTFFQKLMEPDHLREIEYETMKPFLNLPAEKYAGEEQRDNILKH